ncbi:hypothetical protein Ancab_032802 [Ancistrocladus abbreviatus]
METHSQETTPHIAVVPSPGHGHLIPLAEFAKRLVLRHNFSITFLIPTDGSSTKSQVSDLLRGLPPSISHSFLPRIDFSDFPSDTRILIRIILTLSRSIPALRDSLRGLTKSTRLVALIVDLFGSPVLDLARELNVPTYVFFTSSALSLCSFLYLPKLDQSYACEYRELPEPVQFFPGCVPVHGVDFTDSVQDRQSEAYKHLLHAVKQYDKASGFLVNSFLDLEPEAFKALMGNGDAPVYPVGPLVQTGLVNGLASSDRCLRWLDEQPSRSVLFVSFGSGGTLSRDQLTELAFGLELSGQRFLWVVKQPNEKAANATYFNQESVDDPLQFLPHGFLGRTRGLGLVVPTWAPQINILRHDSTGGFLTHCGWNSILESIIHGVPLIAWPLYAEQRLNAVELTVDLNVAFRVKPNEKGVVEREQIAKYAKDLVGGKGGRVLREKMRILKSAAKEALSYDGSAAKSLDRIARIWKGEE